MILISPLENLHGILNFSLFGLDTKRVKIGVEVGPVDWSLQSRSQRDCRDGLVVEVDENGWKASGLQQFADGFYGSFVATMMALPPYFLEHTCLRGIHFFCLRNGKHG